MGDKPFTLRARIEAKTIEIQALVARKHGMGELKDLSAPDRQLVEAFTRKFLEIWEEAYREGDPATQGDDAFNILARELLELNRR
jgi:hypothetical protein